MLLQLVSSPICNVIFVIFIQWDWTQVVTTLKTSFPCLHSLLIKRGSLVCVHITKISVQMGLNTSFNNIKDVRQGKDIFNVVTTCVQSHLY
jgi:hypothetical protein